MAKALQMPFLSISLPPRVQNGEWPPLRMLRVGGSVGIRNAVSVSLKPVSDHCIEFQGGQRAESAAKMTCTSSVDPPFRFFQFAFVAEKLHETAFVQEVNDLPQVRHQFNLISAWELQQWKYHQRPSRLVGSYP